MVVDARESGRSLLHCCATSEGVSGEERRRIFRDAPDAATHAQHAHTHAAHTRPLSHVPPCLEHHMNVRWPSLLKLLLYASEFNEPFEFASISLRF